MQILDNKDTADANNRPQDHPDTISYTTNLKNPIETPKTQKNHPYTKYNKFRIPANLNHSKTHYKTLIYTQKPPQMTSNPNQAREPPQHCPRCQKPLSKPYPLSTAPNSLICEGTAIPLHFQLKNFILILLATSIPRAVFLMISYSLLYNKYVQKVDFFDFSTFFDSLYKYQNSMISGEDRVWRSDYLLFRQLESYLYCVELFLQVFLVTKLFFQQQAKLVIKSTPKRDLEANWYTLMVGGVSSEAREQDVAKFLNLRVFQKERDPGFRRPKIVRILIVGEAERSVYRSRKRWKGLEDDLASLEEFLAEMGDMLQKGALRRILAKKRQLERSLGKAKQNFAIVSKLYSTEQIRGQFHQGSQFLHLLQYFEKNLSNLGCLVLL